MAEGVIQRLCPSINAVEKIERSHQEEPNGQSGELEQSLGKLVIVCLDLM